MNSSIKLPKRVYRHGLSYRYCPLKGPKVNLGRDLELAMAKYHLITAPKPKFDPRDPSVAKQMWARHRKGSKQRGIPFEIELDDVIDALTTQNFICAVTSLEFNDAKPQGLRIRPWLPSIDRIANRRGYVPGNIRIVCAFVNVAMNGFGEEFFEAVLEPLIESRIKARFSILGIDIPAGNF